MIDGPLVYTSCIPHATQPYATRTLHISMTSLLTELSSFYYLHYGPSIMSQGKTTWKKASMGAIHLETPSKAVN